MTERSAAEAMREMAADICAVQMERDDPHQRSAGQSADYTCGYYDATGDCAKAIRALPLPSQPEDSSARCVVVPRKLFEDLLNTAEETAERWPNDHQFTDPVEEARELLAAAPQQNAAPQGELPAVSSASRQVDHGNASESAVDAGRPAVAPTQPCAPVRDSAQQPPAGAAPLTREEIEKWREDWRVKYVYEGAPSEYIATFNELSDLCDMALRSLDAAAEKRGEVATKGTSHDR